MKEKEIVVSENTLNRLKALKTGTPKATHNTKISELLDLARVLNEGLPEEEDVERTSISIGSARRKLARLQREKDLYAKFIQWLLDNPEHLSPPLINMWVKGQYKSIKILFPDIETP